MSCQAGHPDRSRRRPPWYVWCGVSSVALGVFMIVLGAPWTNLVVPVIALSVAVVGWRSTCQR